MIFHTKREDDSPSRTSDTYNFLINNRGPGPRGVEVSIDETEPGDLVQLDFDGDGRFDHTPVILDTGEFTPETMLLAAHS
ncbi:MAG: amidase domain-containing protein, partial [Selenomonadales bacterium]|nr:amidase domain-containing protein [Selenomonadales bacterium]